MLQKIAPNAKVYAVITGDIVGSTKLSPAEMKTVRKTTDEAIKQFDAHHLLLDHRYSSRTRPTGAIAKNVEFSRGDSWQVVLGDPRYALRIALMIQACLRYETKAQTRMAIGIGTVENLERTIGLSTGEAFTLSGRTLEKMTAFRLSGAISEAAVPLAGWFAGILHLCGALTRNWTKRQAELMTCWLKWPSDSDDQPNAEYPTYERIADELKITKQSVSDILISANLPPLRDALNRFQNTDWQGIAGPAVERKT